MQQDSTGTNHQEALRQLPHIIQNLSRTSDIASVMTIVRSAARKLVGADGASFILRDADYCYYADEDAISPLWKGQRFLMKSCISGWVMANAQPATISDIYADIRIPAEAYRTTFVKSMAMVPIRHDTPIGAIGTYWADRRNPTSDEINILQALADATAIAIENIELYDRLQKSLQLRERAVLDNIREGVITFNEDGLITGFNSACETILGYRRLEVLGSNIARMLPTVYAMAIRGKHTETISPLNRKDGSTFSGGFSIAEFMHDEQCCFSVILRDKTEKLKAEETLRASEQRYELAVKGSNAGLWDWDIPNSRLYWSDRFKEMLGISDKSFQPSYAEFKNRLHPDDREEISRRLEEHTRTQLPYDAEFRMLHEDGSYLWVRACGACIGDNNGRATRMAGSLSDISAYKKLQQDFAHTQHMLAIALQPHCGPVAPVSQGLQVPLGKIMLAIDSILDEKNQRQA